MPAARLEGWLSEGRRHLWRPYTQEKTAPSPVAVERTDGVRLYLADGRELIDGISSWWTACHGYNHPHIRAAVERQLAKMPHVMLGGLVHEPASTLAVRLAERLPGTLNRVFFSDSGSVAVEVAMKIAIQHGLNRGEKGRTRFVSFRGGYHGDTFACMSVTDPEEGMHALFQGALFEQIVVDVPRSDDGFHELDALLSRERTSLAGMILEPLVQCAGGMRFHEPEGVARLHALCRKHGILFLLDEVATGFGRTGTMFACEQAGVVPDVVCLSKALTGGTLPLAATVATDEVYEAFYDDDPRHALMHGPTFMANPLACSAALASLELFDREPRLEQVARVEAQLEEELASCREVSGVVDVRVKGAIGAVQLEDGAKALDWLRARFVDEGVWVRPLGDVVYLMPPFVIDEGDLRGLTRAVNVVVREWASRR